MLEIRFHGRGGQGTVVASVLLAKAFFDAGYQVQTFPLFGVERRGAPVEAYLRIDDRPIRLRCNVYTPDHVLVQDHKLAAAVNITQGLKPGGWILFNAAAAPENAAAYQDFRLAWVDASHIAIQQGLGTRTQPIINTAMLGAFARILEMPDLNILTAAIGREIDIKTDRNIAAAQEAYQAVRTVEPPIEP